MKLTPRWIGFGAGAAAALALLTLIPSDSPPPAEELREARLNIEQAMEEGGTRLKKRDLEWARGLHAEARRLRAGQLGRLPLLRNFELARVAHDKALSGSRTLLTEVRQMVAQAQDEAAAVLQAANEAFTDARAAARSARLPREGRSALMQAEIGLSEARLQFRRGAHDAAASTARRVLSTSRRWQEHAGGVLSRLSDRRSVTRWNTWVQETVSWSSENDAPAIVVDKAGRKLYLYDGGALVRSFRVDLGLNPIPDKLSEGDNATPEGRYRVSVLKGVGESTYYRAFLIDYPNAKDWQRFRDAVSRRDIPENSEIGGLIEIHGRGGRNEDWTNGCVAVRDAEMDFLARHVQIGTPVTIVGTLDAVQAPAWAAGGGG